jgi:hypothetical protein
MRSSRTLVSVLLASSSKYSSSTLLKTSVARVAQSDVKRRWYSSKQTSNNSDGGLPPWLTMAGGAVGLGLLARNLLYSSEKRGGRHVEHKDGDVVILDTQQEDQKHDMITEESSTTTHVVTDDSVLFDEKDKEEESQHNHHLHHQQEQDEDVTRAESGKDDDESHVNENEEVENGRRMVIVDSHEVLSSVESVLTKTADAMLREDAESVAESPSHASRETKEQETKQVTTSAAVVDPKISSKNKEDVQITASKLIEMANARGLQVQFDEFSARHKQAEADAETLHELLESYKQQHQTRMEQLKTTEDALKGTLAHLERMQQELLMAQKKASTIQHEKDITRERIKRQEVLDSARLQLDAVSDALSRQSQRAQKSQQAHKISTAVFHLREGLFSSRPSNDVKSSLDYLMTIKDDPVVQVAAKSLQRCGMSIKQHTQLLSDFERRVKKPVQELSYIPEGKGGMLTSLAAKIAHGLKVETDRDEIHGVSKHVEDGELIDAADALLDMLQGTAAMHAAKDWLHDVKTFATARQALHILEARAACINDIHT